ncbi:MAG: GIY-YIG nuclease family protein [Clostridia bacterium]
MPKKQADKSYVYLLKCVDDTLYCGYTNNLQSRLKTHNSGKGAKYTKSRLPVQIVYSETFDSKSAALKRECEIKKLSRIEKLKLIGE